jgi:putative ABC transport system permease protein
MFTKFKWLSLAVRNAMRNRRRSLVTLAITGIGTAAALLGGGFALYTYQSLAQSAARDTGHLIVAAPKHFDGVENTPLEHGLSNRQQLTQKLLAYPEVQRVLPRLQFSGLVTNGEKSEIFLGTGVDAHQEFVVKGPFMKKEEGELLDMQKPGDPPGIVLGKGLAKILNARTGTSLTIMSTTTGGSLNALDVVVTGIVSSGIADLDKRLAMVDLATAQGLLNTDKVSTLSVFLDELDRSGPMAAQLETDLATAAAGGPVEIRTWLQQAFFYKSVQGLYNRIFGFLGVIVLVIVLFSVTNTLAMAVMERTREIGTMRAMGTTKQEIMRLFTLEGVTLGAGGAMIGMLLAGLVALALLVFKVQMPPPPGSTAGYPLVVVVSVPMYAAAALSVTLLSAIASFFVSRKAAHKPVVEALGHV